MNMHIKTNRLVQLRNVYDKGVCIPKNSRSPVDLYSFTGPPSPLQYGGYDDASQRRVTAVVCRAGGAASAPWWSSEAPPSPPPARSETQTRSVRSC